MKDFFISYKAADGQSDHEEPWAKWICGVLENAGYSVVVQARDFRPGSNFVLEIHKALTTCRRLIILLSPAYLEISKFTQAEWASRFTEDPDGSKRLIVPFKVMECSPQGLLKPIVYRSLIGLDDGACRAAVLSAVAIDTDASIVARAPYPGAGALDLETPPPTPLRAKHEASPHAVDGISRARMSRFHLSRSDYEQTLREYLATAKVSISLVSIFLISKGRENDILDLFEHKLRTNDHFFISVSLLDYKKDAVVPAAQSLGMSSLRLESEIRSMFEGLLDLRRKLPKLARRRLDVRAHPSLPPASVILIDQNQEAGKIQVETRLYRAPASESHGYEILSGTPFYQRHLNSYHLLLQDSREVDAREFDAPNNG